MLDVDRVVVELGAVPVDLQGHVFVLQVGVKFVLKKHFRYTIHIYIKYEEKQVSLYLTCIL